MLSSILSSPPWPRRALLSLLCLAWTGTWAQSEEDLSQVYGDSATISIATGRRQSLRRAPAVASVFTAEDIRALGLNDLHELLNLVPGLNVAVSPLVNEPEVQFRGITSTFNQQVLLLVNGMRWQSPYYGRPEEVWARLPLDNVERVEVIRGPGSALYGADAFAGVINVITRTDSGFQGQELRLRAGRFGTAGFGALLGGQRGELRYSLHAGAETSRGARSLIDFDAQSGVDQLLGTHASLAPGPVNRSYTALDLALGAEWRGWRLHLQGKFRRTGTNQGLAHALDPKGWVSNHVGSAQLSYTETDWLPQWDLQAQLAYTHQSEKALVNLFPAGAFGGLFPNGVIGAPDRQEGDGEASVQLSYRGWADHRLRLGAGWRRSFMNHVRERKNFSQPDIVTLINLGRLEEAGPGNIYIVPAQRSSENLLIQDEWTLARDWTLTAGLRHDRDSQFGGVTIPRLALVWDAAYNLSFKLLHGRAFRAPAFVELYVVNNPAYFGNPQLAPERMAMSEAVMDWQVSRSLQTRLNLFRYQMDDILRFVPSADPALGAKMGNLGRQTGHGFEWEWRWLPADGWRIGGNLSHQRSFDELTQRDAGTVPHWMLKMVADWQIMPDWSLSLQGRRVAGRQRTAGDPRLPIPDYSWFDLVLQWRAQPARGWSLDLLVRNLFNADARDPSPAPGAVPRDLPLSGRAWTMQATYRF
ncbi:TonB-dependent receptor [Pelomonas sp. SE-A7]|uniref:TonB-dependent receptor plug domain-containing protein n=1 Tax=Pelomonas sp. SE-A7 TaxID=3054953 RepID=UPI00259CA122|nr:TonB-dependent receptor [Pelomonas sp. SE-A7]MDM4765706.1 TonB-dependent receptor [Pelomonas sp. SE-A7]